MRQPNVDTALPSFSLEMLQEKYSSKPKSIRPIKTKDPNNHSDIETRTLSVDIRVDPYGFLHWDDHFHRFHHFSQFHC